MHFIGAAGIWTLLGVLFIVCLIIWIGAKKIK